MFYSFSFRRTLFFSDTILYFKSQYYFFCCTVHSNHKILWVFRKIVMESQGPYKEAENIRSVFWRYLPPQKNETVAIISVFTVLYSIRLSCICGVDYRDVPVKGAVSRTGLGFWWHKWIDLGLNKRRAWYLFLLFKKAGKPRLSTRRLHYKQT